MKKIYQIIRVALFLIVFLTLTSCKTTTDMPVLPDEYRKEKKIIDEETARGIYETIYHNEDKIMKTERIERMRNNHWREIMTTQKLFWDNKVVFITYTTPGAFEMLVPSNTAVKVSTILKRDGDLTSVAISEGTLTLLRCFTLYDNILYPDPVSTIERFNEFTKDIKKIFGNFIDNKTTGDEFLKDIDGIQKKYSK